MMLRFLLPSLQSNNSERFLPMRNAIKLSSTITISLIILSLLPAEPAQNNSPHPNGYVCFKAENAPIVDGKLDDDAWQKAKWSEYFVDIEGSKKPTPYHKTRMKMTWNDKGLYIAAEIEEPHIWATLKKHDSVIFQDPDFEVFIDPDGDNFLYGELELNALNTTWDLLLPKPYKDGGMALNGWEIIGLKTAVQINGTLNDPTDKDTGWNVEIFWPWEGLKELTRKSIPPKDGDQWRINFSRVEWETKIQNGKYIKTPGKPEYNWVWSPQGVIDMHRPESWGYLQFSTKSSGMVDFKKDEKRGIKKYLHEIYYAQRDFHKKNGRFTSSLSDLGIAPRPENTPSIQTTTLGFEVILMQDGKQYGINSESFYWENGK